MNRHTVPQILACLLLIAGFAPPSALGQVLSPPPPGTVEAGAYYSQQELDQVLAPVALYPDPLISQVLIAATYPLEVVEAARFVDSHRGMTGDALIRLVERQNWDASIKALTAFPMVLTMMAQNLEWTQKLGNAFLAQSGQVMDTIQNLRQRALAQGTLYDTPQQRILYEQQTILIQPVQPAAIAVPYYDPNVVYGPWWIPSRPPYYWIPPLNYRPVNYAEIAVARIVFGLSIALTHPVFIPHWRPDWRNHRIHSVEVHHPVWHHDPGHRRGVAYRDATVRERYVPPPPRTAPDFRGYPSAPPAVPAPPPSSRPQVSRPRPPMPAPTLQKTTTFTPPPVSPAARTAPPAVSAPLPSSQPQVSQPRPPMPAPTVQKTTTFTPARVSPAARTAPPAAPPPPHVRPEIRQTAPTPPTHPFAHIEPRERVDRFSERGHRELAQPVPPSPRVATPPPAPPRSNVPPPSRPASPAGDRHHGK